MCLELSPGVDSIKWILLFWLTLRLYILRVSIQFCVHMLAAYRMFIDILRCVLKYSFGVQGSHPEWGNNLITSKHFKLWANDEKQLTRYYLGVLLPISKKKKNSLGTPYQKFSSTGLYVPSTNIIEQKNDSHYFNYFTYWRLFRSIYLFSNALIEASLLELAVVIVTLFCCSMLQYFNVNYLP